MTNDQPHEWNCPDPTEAGGCHVTCPDPADLTREALALDAKREDRREWRVAPCHVTVAADKKLAEGQTHTYPPCWCRVVDRGPDDDAGVIPSGAVGKDTAELIAFAVNNVAGFARLVEQWAPVMDALRAYSQHTRGQHVNGGRGWQQWQLEDQDLRRAMFDALDKVCPR